jgi:hypothetical protein
MGSFLMASLVGSVILTVVLNMVPRMFPGASRKAEQRLHDYLVDAEDARSPHTPQRRVQVHFPWKAMVIASVVLTIGVNLVALLF